MANNVGASSEGVRASVAQSALASMDAAQLERVGTTHGSANADDQRVPIMFYGAGIKAGQYNDAASPADLTPTLAAIVGITMPQAQGKALSSALATGATPPASSRQ